MSDDIKPLIGLAADRPLTRAEAEAAFDALFEGEATPSQVASPRRWSADRRPCAASSTA